MRWLFLQEIAMRITKLFMFAFTLVVPIIGTAFVVAEEKKAAPAAGQQSPQLPPGWTEEDMKACMLAGTPGKMHEFLASGAGTWYGKSKMWMVPGAPAIESECTSTVTPMFDGRFIKVEMEGDMPGMGPFKGFGIYGFDNVAQKFVSVWIDNHGTGIMNGTGDLSDDQKVTTWDFTFNCPLTKKPTTLREVETITGPNTKTLDMFGADPKTGKEFQMMSIEFTKKSDVARAGK
jgi:hypothetical protein